MREVPFIGSVIPPARTVGGGAGADAPAMNTGSRRASSEGTPATAPQHCR